MGECNDCDACEQLCPMDVRISDYILNNQRVLSTECSLCQTCITVCPRDALKLTFGSTSVGWICCASGRSLCSCASARTGCLFGIDLN